MKDVIVLGAGSHTRSMLGLLDNCGYKSKFIVDINSSENTNEKINNISVVAKDFTDETSPRILSIGENSIRETYFLKETNIMSQNLIHSSAYLSPSVTLGYSNQVFMNVILNENVCIGDNNIINTGAIIEHETNIGSHNHISIGSVIAGRVKIGSRCLIGANSTVIDKVRICSDVIIGAGSVVIKDIEEAGTYVGNPLRRVK